MKVPHAHPLKTAKGGAPTFEVGHEENKGKGGAPGFGVAPQNVSIYRDVALAFPVAIALLIANKPLLLAFDQQPVTPADVAMAGLLVLVAIGLSVLSPNWGGILTGAFAFVALRWFIAFLALRSAACFCAAICFFAVAVLCHRLKPDTDE